MISIYRNFFSFLSELLIVDGRVISRNNDHSRRSMSRLAINFTQPDDRPSFNYYPSASTGFFFFLEREVDKRQECERHLTSYNTNSSAILNETKRNKGKIKKNFYYIYSKKC